ncbi:MAG: PQQ-binding-like beta-propeller repeat protein [Firmicutes bacterium]|nr:PQQ-binding-like beta-propeller repeat protein [Bacillota bacterium]
MQIQNISHSNMPDPIRDVKPAAAKSEADVNLTVTDQADIGSGTPAPEIDFSKAADVVLSSKRTDVKIKWSFENSRDFSMPPAVSPDGSHIFACDGYNVFCIDKSGHKSWEKPLDSWTCSKPVVGPDSSYVVWDKGNQLRLFDKDGNEKWKTENEKPWHSSPIFGKDGTVYVNNDDRHLYAIDPKDGSVKWKTKLEFKGSPRPVECSDGSIAMVDDQDQVYKIKDGKILWDKKMPGRVNGPISVGKDDSVYVTNEDGNLYALNPDGSEKWTYTAGTPLRKPPVEAPDGTLYLPTFTGNSLVALNPDGTKKWEYGFEGFAHAEPVLDKNGNIYIGSNDKNFYALNPDGSLKWKHQFSVMIDEPAVVGADGAVYVALLDKKVHCFMTVKEQLAELSKENENSGGSGKPGGIKVEEERVIIGGVELPRKKNS